MISQTCIQLNKLVRDFDAVQKVANEFISCANEELNKFEYSNIEMQANFPQKRIKKRKLMPAKTAWDEVVLDSATAYKIKVHDIIFDTVSVGMERHFLARGQMLKFDETATGENLLTELRNLALHREKLRNSELEDYKIIKENNSNEDNNELTLEKEEEMCLACETRRAFKNNVLCCYKISA